MALGNREFSWTLICFIYTKSWKFLTVNISGFSVVTSFDKINKSWIVMEKLTTFYSNLIHFHLPIYHVEYKNQPPKVQMYCPLYIICDNAPVHLISLNMALHLYNPDLKDCPLFYLQNEGSFNSSMPMAFHNSKFYLSHYSSA